MQLFGTASSVRRHDEVIEVFHLLADEQMNRVVCGSCGQRATSSLLQTFVIGRRSHSDILLSVLNHP